MIHVGDCLDILPTLGAGSVQACITSPPYYGLRDYGVQGQIGLEETPAAYVARLVSVFRAVRRVLRDDGTLWLNLGDSYCTQPHGHIGAHASDPKLPQARQRGAKGTANRGPLPGLKHKDMIGIPWRVAFALQEDGWYLRQDIIWHKPNPMPESVRDRCTKAHEYLFLLSKGPRYYFDQEAIAEAATYLGPNGQQQSPYAQGFGRRTPAQELERRSRRNSFARETKHTAGEYGQKPQHRPDREDVDYAGRRNKRSVWTVATKPYAGAHFATFPEKLIEPCVLAGAPAGGVVLDPFMGAGTTALVAERLGRTWVGCELNPAYAELARQRLLGRSAGLELGDAA